MCSDLSFLLRMCFDGQGQEKTLALASLYARCYNPCKKPFGKKRNLRRHYCGKEIAGNSPYSIWYYAAAYFDAQSVDSYYWNRLH